MQLTYQAWIFWSSKQPRQQWWNLWIFYTSQFHVRMHTIATVVCRVKANASLEGATWRFHKNTAKFSGKRVRRVLFRGESYRFCTVAGEILRCDVHSSLSDDVAPSSSQWRSCLWRISPLSRLPVFKAYQKTVHRFVVGVVTDCALVTFLARHLNACNSCSKVWLLKGISVCVCVLCCTLIHSVCTRCQVSPSSLLSACLFPPTPKIFLNACSMVMAIIACYPVSVHSHTGIFKVTISYAHADTASHNYRY